MRCPTPATPCAPVRPGTCWSSAPRKCLTGSTGRTGPRASSSPTAREPQWSARGDPGQPAGIGPVVWGSDGSLAETIVIARPQLFICGGPGRLPLGRPRAAPGREPPASRPGVTPEELAAFVPHQANLRIMESLARQLGAPRQRLARRHRRRRATPRPPRSRCALRALIERRRGHNRRSRTVPGLRRRSDLRRPGRSPSRNPSRSPPGAPRHTPTNDKERQHHGHDRAGDPRRPRRDRSRDHRHPGRPRSRPARRSSTTSTSTRCPWSRSPWPPRTSSASHPRRRAEEPQDRRGRRELLQRSGVSA